MRLDIFLHKNGYVLSRTKAAELTEEGSVWLNGKVERKCSAEVSENDSVEVTKIAQYVSRAGLKLRGFLNETDIKANGLDVLDIGSSTGGFVQVWLEEGAKSVTCVDVGSCQLHETLRGNEAIILHEQTDIRAFSSDKKYDIVSCDVSFIGISSLLPNIDMFAKDKIIILFKPQFEVGKDAKRTSKGVVKDIVAIVRSQKRFEAEAVKMQWRLVESKESLVKGKEGNSEIFYYFEKRAG